MNNIQFVIIRSLIKSDDKNRAREYIEKLLAEAYNKGAKDAVDELIENINN